MGDLMRLLETSDRTMRASYPAGSDFYYGHGYQYGQAVGSTAAGVPIDESNALTVSAVYKCVKILAESIGSLPLHLYQRSGDAKKRAPEHSYYHLMHTQPNPEMSAISYRECQVVHMALGGDHYSEKELDGTGKVKALWPLNPSRVTPFRANDGTLAYEFRPGTGETIILTRRQVLHIPGLSFNGITGMSVIAHNRESLGLAKATEQYGARLFSSDTRPGGVLETDKTLGDEAVTRLTKTWTDAHSGLSKAHRIAVLEEGLKFHAISIPPNEAQFLETRMFQAEDIYGMFRIPPHLAGDLEHATYTNIIEQSLEFVIYTLLPWLVRIEQALNIQLLAEGDRKNYFFEHLVDALLRGDPAARWSAYKTGSEIGVLSPNDIRRLQNMNPIPKNKGGDDYHVPMNWAVSGAPKPLPKPPPQIEGPDSATPNEENQARQRELFGNLFLRDASRIMRRETARIKDIAKKHLSADNVPAFQAAVTEHYDTFPEYLARELTPTLESYAQATGVGVKATDIGAMASAEHIRESLTQLKGLGNIAAINQRMDEWSANRPQQLVKQLLNTVEAFAFKAQLEARKIDNVDWEKVYKEGGAHWTEDLQPSLLAQNFAQKLIDLQKQTVLEIGCGNGRDSILFAFAGLEVFAIDIVPEAIKIAEQNAENAGVNIDFQVGDAEAIPLADNSTDAVFTMSVLHATNMKKSIPEIGRILTNKGVACIYIYSNVEKIDGGMTEFIKVDEFIEMLKNSGFEIADIYTTNEEEFDEAGEKHLIIVAEVSK